MALQLLSRYAPVLLRRTSADGEGSESIDLAVRLAPSRDFGRGRRKSNNNNDKTTDTTQRRVVAASCVVKASEIYI